MNTHSDDKRSKSVIALVLGGLPIEVAERLRNRKKTTCFGCGSKKSYKNPMRRCFECKKMFCFDHIWGGLFKDGMSQNESLRHVCDGCKERYGYRSLSA